MATNHSASRVQSSPYNVLSLMTYSYYVRGINQPAEAAGLLKAQNPEMQDKKTRDRIIVSVSPAPLYLRT